MWRWLPNGESTMIRLIPDAESRRQLDEFLDMLENIPRRMAAEDEPIRAAIRRGFALNFLRESAGNGPPWAALAESTNDERERLGYPREHPILVRSGAYKASFIDADADGHVSAQGLSDISLLIEEGSGDIRVGTLELGWVNIPPRPVLGLNFTAEDDIGDEIEAVLNRLLD